MKFPCKVYFPRGKGQPDKVLMANGQAELASLLRIGWKIEASK